MHDWLASRVSHRHLIKDVGIETRQIGNYEIIVDEVLDDLIGDQTLLVYFVCSDYLEFVAKHLLNQVLQNLLLAFLLISIRAEGGNDEAATPLDLLRVAFPILGHARILGRSRPSLALRSMGEL